MASFVFEIIKNLSKTFFIVFNSWVIITTVKSNISLNCAIKVSNAFALAGSKPEVGSSKKRILGSSAKALASATLFSSHHLTLQDKVFQHLGLIPPYLILYMLYHLLDLVKNLYFLLT